jgi:predicted DNA-binding transcriptional regulator YafY
MILFKQLELLRRAHTMIRSAHTGTPADFARRLGISERRLYEVIGEMKALGAPVRYTRLGRTYYYSCDCEARLMCFFECGENVESAPEAKKIDH